ncbi:hypothetical protein Tco_0331840 [Tanacetum coccineum]
MAVGGCGGDGGGVDGGGSWRCVPDLVDRWCSGDGNEGDSGVVVAWLWPAVVAGSTRRKDFSAGKVEREMCVL